MATLNGVLLSLLGFVLICLAHRKHRDAARAHLPPGWLGWFGWLGWLALAVSVVYLVASEPGDLGFVIWFGLHPVLILTISLLAARSMRVVALIAKTSPIAIGLVWLAQGAARFGG